MRNIDPAMIEQMMKGMNPEMMEQMMQHVSHSMTQNGMPNLDPALMRGNPLKKISSPARTFTVMMLAAACAVRIFWTDPRKLWVVTLANKKA